jgi:hypothetical protein
MNKKDKYTAFDVSIEPKFIPGEGRVIEKCRSINMVVYARDINEAITIAKDLVNLNPEDIEVTSACMSGRGSYSV